MTTKMNKYDTAATQALGAQMGGNWTPGRKAGQDTVDYVCDVGGVVQLLPVRDLPSYVSERIRDLHDIEPSSSEIENGKNEYSTIQVEYDLDEHGNRYCERVAIIPQD